MNHRAMAPWIKRAGLVAAGALASTAPVLLAEKTSDGADDTPSSALYASAAWRDVLDSVGAPDRPPPGPTESAIVVLNGDAIATTPPDGRAAAASAITLQQTTAEQSLIGLGATINFRYRSVINGFAIRVPTGRLALVAELPEVKAIYPVTYLTPAQANSADPAAQPLPAAPAAPSTLPAVPPQEAAGAIDPPIIAMIDAGIQSSHPWLGGGIGPDRPIIGGIDHVNGNPGPEASPQARFAEAHGTELAGLVLRSPALQGLAPEATPRMLVHRVVAREFVDGRVRSLARSDRVLAALERAVDPNLDGQLTDRSEVILLGLANGFDSGGDDPLVAAVEAADAVGSLVVAPAGNDGPTFGAVGSVGGPAASDRVLTVGGMSSGKTPRTASLELAVGPAAAALADVPLMGPAPTGEELSFVVLANGDAVARGSELRDYVDSEGRSRVVGAIAIVTRGGGSVPQKAQAAAQAGARALIIWDQDGPGLFPGIRAGGDVPIPVIGVGSRQGALLLERANLRGRIVEAPQTDTAPAVATFSSRGPTASGRMKPDLIAPAVDVETAFPGVTGEARVANASGTSAAAAQVAAMALRVRAQRPDLSTADVRSLMVQSAVGVSGVAVSGVSPGVARVPDMRAVTLNPAVISGRRTPGAPTTFPFTVRDVAGTGGQFRVALSDESGVIVPPGAPIAVAPGGSAPATLTIPAGRAPLAGTVHVLDTTGATVAVAPFVASSPVTVPVASLGVPQIRSAGSAVEARVAIGVVDRRSAMIVVSPVRDVGLWLVPAGGGEPIRMAGEKQRGDWAAGTYRFALTRNRANGQEIPAGRYRLRVAAVGLDGRRLVRSSAPFRLG